MDLTHAVRRFEEYLDDYDREDDKIRLKITHTYGVMEYSKKIAERMELSTEDQTLAQIIGLLHDIGRFEQVKRYDSFEPGTMDHAGFGVEILFGEGLIREFVEEDTWDPVIRTAIAKHSDFRLEGIPDERELLHAKIIRDADKLDNCRVKLYDPVETFMGASAEEVGRDQISEEVMNEFRKRESIFSPLRKTKMDYWLSYLAYFFDINFPASFAMIVEENYLSRLEKRIPYTNPKTAEEMREVFETLDRFIREGAAR